MTRILRFWILCNFSRAFLQCVIPSSQLHLQPHFTLNSLSLRRSFLWKMSSRATSLWLVVDSTESEIWKQFPWKRRLWSIFSGKLRLRSWAPLTRSIPNLRSFSTHWLRWWSRCFRLCQRKRTDSPSSSWPNLKLSMHFACSASSQQWRRVCSTARDRKAPFVNRLQLELLAFDSP